MAFLCLNVQAALILLRGLFASLAIKLGSTKRCGEPRSPSTCPAADADEGSAGIDPKKAPDTPLIDTSEFSAEEGDAGVTWRSSLARSDTVLVFCQTSIKWYTGVVTAVRPGEITVVFCPDFKMFVKDLPISSPHIKQALDHDQVC
eukprot:TRINITY_DN19574_c0_g2_i1.p1 TRINITY_DN19574_c0_g2~~TRINITY_DN19574_c0_g2_i1.p1  ORF type:complete len:162 (+),score=25.08 TRINITY_DN19574_c0_g2_i1:49-486(+)